MDKQAKIIPINGIAEEPQEERSAIVDNLLNTLSDIDQELERHLNSSTLKQIAK